MEDFPVEEERQMRGNWKKVGWESVWEERGIFTMSPEVGYLILDT